MAGIDEAVYAHVEALPDHRRVLEAVLAFFRKDPPAIGAWVAGSVARGDTDEYSDLDVGICFRDEPSRTAAWSHRWDWLIAPWFHRFDADHVRPYFVIYLFEGEEPGGTPVKADLALYLEEELPPPEGGPYRVAWDDEGLLSEWATRTGDRHADWALAPHEDERFWAWTFYCLQHVRRGEYYEIASELHWLRGIVEVLASAPRRARAIRPPAGRAELRPRRPGGHLPGAEPEGIEGGAPEADRAARTPARRDRRGLANERGGPGSDPCDGRSAVIGFQATDEQRELQRLGARVRRARAPADRPKWDECEEFPPVCSRVRPALA